MESCDFCIEEQIVRIKPYTAENLMDYCHSGVSSVSASFADLPYKHRNRSARYKELGPARERLYAALAAFADAGAPCPSNRDLCQASSLGREAEVTTLLGILRDKELIAVEWSGQKTGARRILILGTGMRTDWSLHGPRAADDTVLPANGTKAMGLALGPHRRFTDVTRVEARAISRNSPPDCKLRRPQRAESEIGCALAGLRGNPEFDWR